MSKKMTVLLIGLGVSLLLVLTLVRVSTTQSTIPAAVATSAQPVIQPDSGFPDNGGFPTPMGGPAFVVATPTPRPETVTKTEEKQGSFAWADLPLMLASGFWWIAWKALAWLSWAWIFNGLSKFFRNVHSDNFANILDAPWQMVRSMAARDVPGPTLGLPVVVFEIVHLLLVFLVGNPVLWVLAIPFVVLGALKVVSMLGIPFFSWLGIPWDRLIPWLFAIAGPRLKGVEKRLKGEKDSKPDKLDETEKKLKEIEASARTALLRSARAEINKARRENRDPARWAVEALKPRSSKPNRNQQNQP